MIGLGGYGMLDFFMRAADEFFNGLFCTLTNVTSSTAPYTHWYRISIGAHRERTIFVAELLGTMLRCSLIVALCYAASVVPYLRIALGILLLFYAVRHTIGWEPARLGEGRTYTVPQAIAGIAYGEVVLNLDSMVATIVEVSVPTLALSMVVYVFLYVLFRGTSLGAITLRTLRNVAYKIGHPRDWWSVRSPFFRTMTALMLLGLGLATMLMLLLVAEQVFVMLLLTVLFGGRAVQGIRVCLVDLGELVVGIWTFICVLLGVVMILSDPLVLKSLLTPFTLYLADYVTWFAEMKQGVAVAIVMWSVSASAAMLGAWIYAPIIERRAIAKSNKCIVILFPNVA